MRQYRVTLSEPVKCPWSYTQISLSGVNTNSGIRWGEDFRDGMRLVDSYLLRRKDPFILNLTNGYTRSGYEYYTRSCFASIQSGEPNNWFFFSVKGDYVNTPSWDNTFISDASLRAQAKTDLINSLYELHSGRFDPLLATLEFGKTFRMIREKGTIVSDSFDRFARDNQPLLDNARRSRNFPLRRRITRKVVNRYLELTFGLFPLLSDIDNAAYDLAKSENPERLRARLYRKSSRRTRTDVDTVTYIGTAGQNQNFYRLYRNSISSIAYSYHGVFRDLSVLDPSSAANASRIPGLSRSVRNFVPTLYEAIPYSFLVDYFTNLGALASAFVINDGSALIYSKSEKGLREIWYNVEDANPSVYSGTSVQVGPSSYGDKCAGVRGFRFIRENGGESVYTDLVTLRVPGFRQLINTAALAIQRFTR